MEHPIQVSTRTRRSKHQIKNLLHEFEKSKSNVKDFCKLHNINTGNFHKWKSRYKTIAVTRNRNPGFAKLNVIETSSASLFAEVNGIKLYQPVSSSFLKELL